MKMMRRLAWNGMILGLAMVYMAVTGCDDADTSDAENYTYGSYGSTAYTSDATSSDTLTITPSASVVTFSGPQFTFQVNGGPSPYTWGLGNSALGTLVVGSSKSYATYTASQVGANTVIVSDSAHQSAVATISITAVADLSITVSPDAIMTTDGEKVSLKVTGGMAPYSWAADDTTLGNIIGGSTASTAVYMRYHSGDNYVKVIDSQNNVAYAVISQPE